MNLDEKNIDDYVWEYEDKHICLKNALNCSFHLIQFYQLHTQEFWNCFCYFIFSQKDSTFIVQTLDGTELFQAPYELDKIKKFAANEHFINLPKDNKNVTRDILDPDGTFDENLYQPCGLCCHLFIKAGVTEAYVACYDCGSRVYQDQSIYFVRTSQFASFYEHTFRILDETKHEKILKYLSESQNYICDWCVGYLCQDNSVIYYNNEYF